MLVAQSFLAVVIVGIAVPLQIHLNREVWRLNRQALTQAQENPDPELGRRRRRAITVVAAGYGIRDAIRHPEGHD